MANPKLLLLCGSLRAQSYNRMLLAEAVGAFGPAEVTEADLRLPLYDGDVEAKEGFPGPVQVLAGQIRDADALVIAAPEYNKGITGVLKNALDWVSRVPGAVLAGKPVVVMSAAGGRTGGETAQFMTLSCLTQLQARLLPGPMVLVAAAHDEFDETGRLTNALYKDVLETRMAALRAELAR